MDMIQCPVWVEDLQEWAVVWVIHKGHHLEQFRFHKRKWKQLIVYSNLDSRRHVLLKLILPVIKMKKWQQTFYSKLVLKMKMVDEVVRVAGAADEGLGADEVQGRR